MTKILFLGANGIDTSRLRIGAELRDVQAEIERARIRNEIELRVELAVTPVDLNRLLLDYAPDIVHFSGHGTSLHIETHSRPGPSRELLPHDDGLAPEATETGALLFETHEGHAAHVSTRALVQLFGILKTPRCVVLNACFSAEQAEALAPHVDCVIGMKRAMDDQSAILFAVGFYQAIARGQTVKTAFELGCSLLSTGGGAGADVPELRGRADPEAVRLVGAGMPAATTNALQVSDVHVIPNRGERTYTLDFRIWNGGDANVLINRVMLRVIDVESLVHRTLGYHRFSHEYELDISDLAKPGDAISCNVSQLIEPRGVDRFGIRVDARDGEPRRCWLRTSLFTSMGSVEGPVVELDLPIEDEASYLRRREQEKEAKRAAEARRLAWLNAAPDEVAPYLHDMQESKVDLSKIPVIREALERAYPDPVYRGLILFEWFGKGGGSWNEGSIPERLLLEIPTAVLVESLARQALTSAHLHGAAMYLAGGRFTAMKLADRALLTDDIKAMLLEHSLTAGYDRGERFAVECAIGMHARRG